MILVNLSNSSFAEVTDTREGDLVVEKDQTLTIKDKTFSIDGDLILKEDSTLVIENATLIVIERYKSEHALKTSKSKVKIINSEIRSAENVIVETHESLAAPELNLHMEDNTQLVIENSKVYGRVQLQASSGNISNSIVSQVYWTFDSNLEITETVLGSFAFDCKESAPRELLLEGLEKNKSINFDVEDPLGGSLKIRDSNIKEIWSFNLEYDCQKKVTVKNSDFNLFWITFPPTENRIRISNLPPRGLVEEFELKKAISGMEMPYDVKLINTRIDMFKPQIAATAEIVNSYVMVHPMDTADLIIKDSTLKNFYNYGSKRIEFFNTDLVDHLQLLYIPEYSGGFKIGDKTIGPGGYFHFIFHNSTINVHDIIIAHFGGIIEGDVQIISPKNLEKVHWNQGIVTRIYPVIAEPGIKVIVLEDGQEKWNGNTDEKGKTFFNITFDKENYQKKFVVKTGEISKEVGFLTDTPVIFEKKLSFFERIINTLKRLFGK